MLLQIKVFGIINLSDKPNISSSPRQVKMRGKFSSHFILQNAFNDLFDYLWFYSFSSSPKMNFAIRSAAFSVAANISAFFQYGLSSELYFSTKV